MAKIIVNNVTFCYDGSYENVFSNLSLVLDTDWKLGIIGRNGKGKSTLLKLFMGQLKANYDGDIHLPLKPVLFPFETNNNEQDTIDILQEIAPAIMLWQLQIEFDKLLLPEELLYRKFNTLSKGEQTKIMLCALFLRDDVYPLIDEPTNHLDIQARMIVGNYLKNKNGFMLVSHDRAFLNTCIDHTLSLNKESTTVMQGNFESWEREFTTRNDSEIKKNDQLKKEIARLFETVKRVSTWSDKVEKTKYNVHPSEVAAVDRGYVGARSAAMMKRANNTLARVQKNIELKKELMNDVEKINQLKIHMLPQRKKQLITVKNGKVQYENRIILRNLQFTVEKGDVIALVGKNGSGKSSILNTLQGKSSALKGEVNIANNLIISEISQSIDDLYGSLDEFIKNNIDDETLFKAILRNMDFSRTLFDQNIENYSDGQKKKLLIAKSLSKKAHIYIWDEPLNYIDIFNRIQIQNLLTSFNPTMILVEHDKEFLEKVCNKIVNLDDYSA